MLPTWMEAWSRAERILLEALHFLGMGMSTCPDVNVYGVTPKFGVLLRIRSN